MKKELEARGVDFILHFTQESNLESIVKHGLVPRDQQDSLPGAVAVNDMLRLDFKEGASSFSIGFPNYKLFYKFRKDTEAQGVDWAVVVFCKRVLLDKECLYCPTNAADASVSGRPEAELKGVEAFRALYNEVAGKPPRKSLGLNDSWPTNPQAEILVKGVVEPNYIRGIAFKNSMLTDKYKEVYPALKVITAPAFFDARKDYEHWK